MYDNVFDTGLWFSHSATYFSMIFQMVQSFNKRSNFLHIMITCAPIQYRYTVIFRALKIAIVKFMKKMIFLIFAQNLDCGYLIELHQPSFAV